MVENIQDQEARKCMGCGDEGDGVFMFKGKFANDEGHWVEEVYCNECLANILTESPEDVSHVEAKD